MNPEDKFYGNGDRYRDAIAEAFGHKFRDERSDKPVCPDGSERGYQEIWRTAMNASTERLRPLAAKANERNVSFAPDNDFLWVGDPAAVNADCQAIVNPKGPRFYHGCTKQHAPSPEYDKPFVKPESMTYLSRAWSENSFVRGARHEASHLEIRTMMQLMAKLNRQHSELGLKHLGKEDFDRFMDAMMSVDALLDYHEVPQRNPLTGKVELDKNYDVIPQMEELLTLFYSALGLKRGN